MLKRNNIDFDLAQASKLHPCQCRGRRAVSAVMAADCAQQELEQRIRADANPINHLRCYRPEKVGDLVNMGNGVRIELGLLADLLSSMVRRHANSLIEA